MQRISEAVQGDAISGVELLYEFDEVRLRVGESEIFEPVRPALKRFRRASVKRIQVIEQHDRKAAGWAGTVLWEVGERVLGQQLDGLVAGFSGLDREKADGLGFPSIKHDEVILCQIGDRAVLITGDDTYLNQPGGHTNCRRLRFVLSRNGSRRPR